MASKIFMGDMPELMENILNNLKNKPNSLYSKWTEPNLIPPLSVISSNTYYEYFDAVVNVVINLLLKSLFESGAVLHKLFLWFPEYFEFKPEIFYSLGRNELLFSRLQHLFLYVTECNIKSITIFLNVLAKNITTISSLDLVIHSDFESRLFHTLFHATKRIIKSQEQLKRFSFDGVNNPTEFYGIISALECQKKLFKRSYNNSKLLNFLDCKISTLEVFDCPIDVQTILENSGLLLQRLSFDPIEFGNEIHEVMFFLEALKSFCPNITYLNIKYSKFSKQLLELIGNLQKLQFLSLSWFVDDEIPEEELKIRVMKFAEILPLTLQYLDLGDNWQPSIDILLSHCNVPLKKLLIYRLNDEKHIRALIEFCIRNKDLNYVGIYKYSDLDETLRKEVEAHVTNVALVPWSRIVVDC
ncbi:hypothetical protein F8M41_020124 [Gigaspora margarita]|uniref:Uncharacterized protein n=1 Tax=Gigaspora margarita TaxID=4874 RepID=A0A8H4AJ02_GIGMA|nr:hypothetical protein F8M41_020124 [Gigaspora margarita]